MINTALDICKINCYCVEIARLWISKQQNKVLIHKAFTCNDLVKKQGLYPAVLAEAEMVFVSSPIPLKISKSPFMVFLGPLSPKN